MMRVIINYDYYIVCLSYFEINKAENRPFGTLESIRVRGKGSD
jgi:hypothetical protein